MHGTGHWLTAVLGAAAVAVSGRADPPTNSAWRLTFDDEFEQAQLDADKWMVECDLPGHVQSARHPENVVVADGVCKLLNKKQDYRGRAWTGGHIWSKEFEQQAGYFEARIKIAAAGGLNNGFWLTPDGKPGTPGHFELDPAALYHPKNVETYLCNRCDPFWTKGEKWEAPDDLSKEFHVYGMLWTETEIVWYFDGQEIRRAEQDNCRKPVRVRFSTAVTTYAGEPTDAIHDTFMALDYVRVFEPVEQVPRWPVVLQGVQ